MTVSVVISTIDSRVELLERGLWCYTMQTYQPLEVIIVADRPKTNETRLLVEEYQANYELDVKYFELAGPDGWRNGYGQNKGIYESSGSIAIATHPGVMMEFDAVEAIVDRLNGEDNVCAMLMWVWLSSSVNEQLKATDKWREDMSFIRDIITEEDYGWLPRVGDLASHAKSVLGAIKIAPGSSSTFWQSAAMTRETWLRIGGFTLMNTWGSMDSDFIKRKRILGIPTRIVKALSYHQWHPAGPTHNEFEVFEYEKPEDAIRELKWE